MPTRIVLADDHQIVRAGLRGMIESTPGLTVAGEAATGHEAVKLAGELRPDIILMDVTMPDLNGIEATRRITGERPEIRIIALSMHHDRRYISEMLRAGASGYLLKSCSVEELRTALRVVKDGHSYISLEVADTVVKDYVSRLRPEESFNPGLSPREREVLQLLAEGKSTKEIASHLRCSAKTVDFHRGNVMRKLNIHSIAELTKYAIREGLTGEE